MYGGQVRIVVEAAALAICHLDVPLWNTGRMARREERRWGATAHAALVLLAFGPASGYELKQRADSTLRFFFASPAMSQIYAELDRLAAAGLVADHRERRGGERETRVFSLTPAGRAELRRWLAEDSLPATVFKSHLAMRLVIGYLAEPERVRADIATERERTVAEREALEKVAVALDPTDAELGWARLVADWGLRYFTDVVEQLDLLTAGLDRLVAEKQR
jgi:DNA-binding PadR family transcriptional regulator